MVVGGSGGSGGSDGSGGYGGCGGCGSGGGEIIDDENDPMGLPNCRCFGGRQVRATMQVRDAENSGWRAWSGELCLRLPILGYLIMLLLNMVLVLSIIGKGEERKYEVLLSVTAKHFLFVVVFETTALMCIVMPGLNRKA